MPITRIKRLRDCGVFHDFAWPAELPECAQFNLVYGWNGAGKTTLSKLFRCLELKTVPAANGQFSFTIDGQDVDNACLAQLALPIRVFNRDFVNESVFPTDGAVAPIFVLGKENVEKQKKVTQLKKSLADANQDLSKARQAKSAADGALDRFCIEKARGIKDALRSSGSNPFNNYDKRDFTQRCDKMLADGDQSASLLKSDVRDRLLSQLRTRQKSKIDSISYRLPNLTERAAAISQLLARTVVSSAIESLKDDAAVSSWVHAGLALHKDRAVADCLFCDQKLPGGRLAALEAHFSAEYERLLMDLTTLSRNLQTEIDQAANLATPNAAELYEDLSDEFVRAANALSDQRKSARLILDALRKSLESKKDSAFQSVTLGVTVPALNTDAVKSVNDVIEKHNQACDEFDSRIDAARKQLESDSVAGSLGELQDLKTAVSSAQSDVDAATGQFDEYTHEITRLEREIVEHQQPAEELNSDLRNYLGHGELCLEVKDTGYTIMRRNSPADSLSEGEMTAIALLYFLKSLQDHRFELQKGVVVLDDPVSSLDANALYSAFGFIRGRTKDAAQLFILTHNFTFFRQVRNWFHNLPHQKKKDIARRPARFYMLDCTHEQGRRCAGIRPLDPLLEIYESEYHYLFACVYRASRAVPPPPLEQNYKLPNLARRLMEAFLAFRQPHISGDLWKKLQEVPFDETKKIRIIRFLHTHSHSDAISEAEHDLSLLSEAQPILSDLLNLMQAQDASHYAAMESLVTACDAPEDDE